MLKAYTDKTPNKITSGQNPNIILCYYQGMLFCYSVPFPNFITVLFFLTMLLVIDDCNKEIEKYSKLYRDMGDSKMKIKNESSLSELEFFKY